MDQLITTVRDHPWLAMVSEQNFLAEEGLWHEAKEYLEDYKDDEIPIDFSFVLE